MGWEGVERRGGSERFTGTECPLGKDRGVL